MRVDETHQDGVDERNGGMGSEVKHGEMSD